MNTEVLKMKPEYTGQRVDRQLSELMPELSRSYIQKLLKEGMVLANGKPVKANYKKNGKEEIHKAYIGIRSFHTSRICS